MSVWMLLFNTLSTHLINLCNLFAELETGRCVIEAAHGLNEQQHLHTFIGHLTTILYVHVLVDRVENIWHRIEMATVNSYEFIGIE